MSEQAGRTPHELLETGEFSTAAEIFGTLLEGEPENSDYACGFYSASYWANRSDLISPEKQGRKSGAALLREWDRFENIAREKGFTEELSFRSSMRSILSAAASHLRMAFQSEGASQSDTENLLDIVRCLLRIEDYRNAADMLVYLRRLSPGKSDIRFLLGQTLLMIQESESTVLGLSHLRDALLDDPDFAVKQPIFAPELAEVRIGMEDFFGEESEHAADWFAAFFALRFFRSDLRRPEESGIRDILRETDRLTHDFTRVSEQFRDRVAARVAFYALYLIHYFRFVEKDTQAVRKYEEAMELVNPEFYQLYRKQKKEG